jgi:lysozyme family protein
MADASTAIEFVLRQEDSTLSGKVTTDKGGRTRFGIAERYHPELVTSGFYSQPAPVALAAAQRIYAVQYWNPIQGGLVTSQYVADRLLSFCVNLGIHESIKLVQGILNASGAKLHPDGNPGPATIAAINAATTNNEAAFIAAWRAALIAFYQRVVALDPSQANYLQGWLNRVAV